MSIILFIFALLMFIIACAAGSAVAGLGGAAAKNALASA